MSDEREEQEGKRKFKIVDRRRFDDEGEMRPEAVEREEEEAQAPAVDAAPTPAAAPEAVAARDKAFNEPADPTPAPDEHPGTGEEGTAIPFGAFLQSLAQQCVMQLGMIPFPSGQRQLDLEGARDTVDILSMLKVKTHGNLSADESKAFDQILYELRMTYTEVSNRVAAAGAPGSEPPPGA